MGSEPKVTKINGCFEGMPTGMHLDEFGRLIKEAFNDYAFQVGSSLESKKWRDVDIRLILDDDVFYGLFGDESHGFMETNPRWRSFCMAYAALANQMTGLPIDFQIQPRTWANERFDGPRNAIGIICGPPKESPALPDPLTPSVRQKAEI